MKTETKVTHTPTPWQRGPDGFIIKTRPGTTNLVIAEYLSGNPADAAFIVRAVNAHEELLKYVRRYAELCKRDGGDHQSVEQAIAKAEASQ